MPSIGYTMHLTTGARQYRPKSLATHIRQQSDAFQVCNLLSQRHIDPYQPNFQFWINRTKIYISQITTRMDNTNNMHLLTPDFKHSGGNRCPLIRPLPQGSDPIRFVTWKPPMQHDTQSSRKRNYKFHAAEYPTPPPIFATPQPSSDKEKWFCFKTQSHFNKAKQTIIKGWEGWSILFAFLHHNTPLGTQCKNKLPCRPQ